MTTTINGTPRDKRARFLITLEGVAGVNTIHQLRHLLKLLLRTSGLRCTDARTTNFSPLSIKRGRDRRSCRRKRRAESFVLMAIPLAAVDPKMAARIKRDNEAPHPMGPPLNRPPLTGDATSDWRPTGNGAGVSDIPDFLRRRP